jgi:4-carboxymuconolactone decarboxylase
MPPVRFPNIDDAAMTPEQAKVAETLRASPRKGLPGPFHALLRSPDLAARVQGLGDYIRYGSSLPATLRELTIMIVARFWSAHYEWQAHRRIGIEAGLDPSIGDAIAEGRRPEKLSADEALVYDFMSELVTDKDVSDKTYAAAVARFGERTVLDMIATGGYFSFVSLILNAKRHPLPDGTQGLPPAKR